MSENRNYGFHGESSSVNVELRARLQRVATLVRVAVICGIALLGCSSQDGCCSVRATERPFVDAGIGVFVPDRHDPAASRFGSTGNLFSGMIELDLLMLDEAETSPETGGWRGRMRFSGGRLPSDDDGPIYISTTIEPWPSQVYRDVNELWISGAPVDKMVYGLALPNGGRTHAYRDVSEVFMSLREGRWVQGSFQLGSAHPRSSEMRIASDPFSGDFADLAAELAGDSDWVEFHCPLIVRCYRRERTMEREYVHEADWSSNQCTAAAIELGLEGWLPPEHAAHHDDYEESFLPW